MKTANRILNLPVLSAVIGAALAYGAMQLTSDSTGQLQTIHQLENQIADLQFQLVQQEQQLKRANVVGYNNNQTIGLPTSANSNVGQMTATFTGDRETDASTTESETTSTTDQLLKDLSTVSERDPRPFSSKVRELLQINNSAETVALVSQSMAYLADNSAVLPDHELDSLYQQQPNDELKRVAAQVMSLRGDNRLLEQHITSLQPRLNSETPQVRQQALIELAKTGYANAAKAIAPLLDDEDTGVKLDALLALRATGNQSHLHLAEKLRNHSDPSVSWLANDVIDHLQNLSDVARTKLRTNDITANLRPVASIH